VAGDSVYLGLLPGHSAGGLYRANAAGDTVFYSHNELMSSFLVPCNDYPGDKATLQLSAVLPAAYTLSEGRRRDFHRGGNGGGRSGQRLSDRNLSDLLAAGAFQVLGRIGLTGL